MDNGNHAHFLCVLQRRFIRDVHVQSEHLRLPSGCSQSMDLAVLLFSSFNYNSSNDKVFVSRLCNTAGWTSPTLTWKNTSITSEQKTET